MPGWICTSDSLAKQFPQYQISPSYSYGMRLLAIARLIISSGRSGECSTLGGSGFV